ncbi:DUF6873 family GME fold protein [Saccharicrinis aurantiacus]|uniref:DUF6873 family GME fold protein n=1 Tax=Saccharicrinis aurantiacus TaxID=1849719 RepID=UPI00248F80D9|nr:hypothetical protein [Saccharicrinis aurantiacus]
METIKKARLVLVDNRIISTVRNKLMPFAESIEGFKSKGITYNAVSCHPDVFIHQSKNSNIIAPNTPSKIVELFNKKHIPYQFGESTVGTDLIGSTPYNCITTEAAILHKKGFTDATILNINTNATFINLPQAYTRCTTLVLRHGLAVSSDHGVLKTLRTHNWEVLYFDPSDIRIIDHRNGFFGGCCGIFNNTVFTLGNLLLHKDGEQFRNFLTLHGFKLEMLSNEKLYDGGGILFF